MAGNDLTLLTMLKTRMQWHQSRQKVLAENVANADTPGFKPHDLKEPRLASAGPAALHAAITDSRHLALPGGDGFDGRNAARFETTPSGNGVTLEDEMMKVAQNQADYQMATMLYSKSLQLLKTAVGKR